MMSVPFEHLRGVRNADATVIVHPSVVKRLCGRALLLLKS
jgi:hypothetical protein